MNKELKREEKELKLLSDYNVPLSVSGGNFEAPKGDGEMKKRDRALKAKGYHQTTVQTAGCIVTETSRHRNKKYDGLIRRIWVKK